MKYYITTNINHEYFDLWVGSKPPYKDSTECVETMDDSCRLVGR